MAAADPVGEIELSHIAGRRELGQQHWHDAARLESPHTSPSSSFDSGRARRSRDGDGGADGERADAETSNGSEEILQAPLPRADGGKDAWCFLLAGFMFEALIWGFPFSYGIFQDYYAKTEPFASEPSGLAIIGTCESGIMYLGSPFLLYALQVSPRLRRPCCLVGIAIIGVGLVASSFANSVWQLILTQGVLYAIGGSLAYCPAMIFLDDWFIKRKGFALGIMWAGTGASGVVVPFIMQWLLSSYGFRTALRAWAVVVVLLTVPLQRYVKPRVPLSRSSTSTPRRISFAFMRSTSFWVLAAGNTLEGLGYFIPSIYIPSYAQAFALPSVAGSLVLALTNLAAVFGTIGLGVLSDHVHVTTVMMISAAGSAAAVLLVWGFSASLPLLCVFGVLYGAFAGGFSSTWAGVVKHVKAETPGTEMSTVLGMLTFGRGIGSVISGPLSEALLRHGSAAGASSGYGSSYSTLIIFTGVTAFMGGLGFLGRQVKLV